MNAERHRLALPEGCELGKYRLHDVLGAGGFGITYLAEDCLLGRWVAIKELLPGDIATRVDGATVVAKTQGDESILQWARKRFVEEGRAIAACDHPNVIHVYELIEANGTAYMVTKFEEGCSLEVWLRDLGRVPEEAELRGILHALLSGLEKVHSAGFLHRDIKPENIYLTMDGRPVLLDFGSARQAISDRTMALTVVVTAGYAPFEQYHEDGKQGAWSDIYALAAVIYRAITGKKPPEATRRLQDDPCVKLSKEFWGTYSSLFLSAIDAALSVDISKRPQDVASWRLLLEEAPAPMSPMASEVVTPLTEQASGNGATSDPETSPKPGAAVGAASCIEESVSKAAPIPARAPGNLVPLLASAGTAILLVGGWVIWKMSHPELKPQPPMAAMPIPVPTPAPAPTEAPTPAPTFARAYRLASVTPIPQIPIPEILTAIAREPTQITILKAVYGSSNALIDVSDYIKSQLLEGDRRITVGSQMGGGQDPSVGKQKFLWLEYSIGDAPVVSLKVPEGRSFALPSHGATSGSSVVPTLAVSIATPIPVTPAPKRLAPEGVFYVIRHFSTTTDDGLIGVNPGTKVKQVKDNGDTLLVTNGQTQFEASKDDLTNDLDIAYRYAVVDGAAQQQLSRQARAEEKAGQMDAKAQSDTERSRQAKVASLRSQIASVRRSIEASSRSVGAGASASIQRNTERLRALQAQLAQLGESE